MALIKCLECGKEISDTVDICPNCGFSIKKKGYNKKILFLLRLWCLELVDLYFRIG